jgi:hypothetical protein
MSIFEVIIGTNGILLVEGPQIETPGFLQNDYPEWV